MNQRKFRISALSYSNTFPFVLGLNQLLVNEAYILDFEVPSLTAERFFNGEVDMALVPVGALLSMSDYKIISNYCIGANGKVKTVCLYTNVHIEEIEKIYLDTDSRTSMRLVQILAKYFWKISPIFVKLEPGQKIENNQAVLLIGDKTFGVSDKYKFTFDLAEEWKKFTNLPFVFALWIAKNSVPDFIVDNLNDALKFGLSNIKELKNHFDLPVNSQEYEDYIENYIDYNLDETKKEAMKLFLDYAKEMGI